MNILVIFYAIYILICHKFTESVISKYLDNELNENQDENGRVKAINDLYLAYISKHGQAVVKQEAETNPKQFSNRFFVTIPSLSCGNLGNDIFAPLSGLSHAVILNRTIVAGPISIVQCFDNFLWNSWVPTHQFIIDLMIKAKCSDAKTINFHEHYPATRTAQKCYLDRYEGKLLSFWHQEYDPYLFFNRYSGSLLGELARIRADILLSNPVYVNSRSEILGYSWIFIEFFRYNS